MSFQDKAPGLAYTIFHNLPPIWCHAFFLAFGWYARGVIPTSLSMELSHKAWLAPSITPVAALTIVGLFGLIAAIAVAGPLVFAGASWILAMAKRRLYVSANNAVERAICVRRCVGILMRPRGYVRGAWLTDEYGATHYSASARLQTVKYLLEEERLQLRARLMGM